MQAPSAIIMVRPLTFGFNLETAQSNSFQTLSSLKNVNLLAQQEFDSAINTLKRSGARVRLFEDTPTPRKPDSIFPNNWFSTHPNGNVILYPMLAKNRRQERRSDIIDSLTKSYKVSSIIDLTEAENNDTFLEGTGSIVFDHIHKVAYASISPRTNLKLLDQLCNRIGYTPFSFSSYDLKGLPVYVILSIGTDYAIVCTNSLDNLLEQQLLLKQLKRTKKTVIEISLQQMNMFAANCLEIEVSTGNILALSSTALTSLTSTNIKALQSHLKLVELSIPTIETIGGGSVRCMMAGIHLPLNT